MNEKEQALKQIFSLMDKFNLSKADVEGARKDYYPKEARSWLKNEHHPGWYITADGVSSPNPPDLTKVEIFGIWRSDTLIICSQVMYQPDSFEKAEEFIRGKNLGPFYFRMADDNEIYGITDNAELISKALANCGLPRFPEDAFYWYNRKIIFSEKDQRMFINNTSRNLSTWAAPEAKYLGIYLINLV